MEPDEPMDSIDEDVALMRRTQAGEPRAFERLFQRHARPVMNFVRRFAPSHAVAEEWTQDVFLKVYRARDSWEPRAKFRTFVLRVATNHCLNELRRGVHRAHHESMDAQSSSDEAPRHELVSDAAGSDALVHAGRLSVAVDQAIQSLPDNQRAALLLLRFDGQSYEEIGVALNMSVPAIKSLLNRAKTSLRSRLGAFLGAEDELPVL